MIFSRSKHSLTIHTTLTIAWTLTLGLISTTIVAAMLWQRSDIVHFARKEQEKLSIFLENEENPLTAIVEHSEAQACLLLTEESGKQVIGTMNNELSALLASSANKTKAGGQTIIQTAGFRWNTILPARSYLIISTITDKRPSQTVAVLYNLEPVYKQLRQHLHLLWLFCLINIMVLTVVGLLKFRKIILKPIGKLIFLSEQYKDSDHLSLLQVDTDNEIGMLSSSLQKMLSRINKDQEKLQLNVSELEKVNQELLSTRDEMIKAEKLASTGRLAAGLAHEIGNPIGIVQGYLDLLTYESNSKEEKKEYIKRAKQELNRINTLVKQLLDIARDSQEENRPLSINDLLREITQDIAVHPLIKDILITTSLNAEHDIVNGNRSRLHQVFLNCILNAADSLSEINGRKQIRIQSKTDNNKLTIIIADNGKGIKTEVIDNVFEPFFTTKEPGKGTGLGLAVSWSIIEQHKGNISLQNRQEGGCKVIITLPIVTKNDRHNEQ